jgi:hypothetical protein
VYEYKYKGAECRVPSNKSPPEGGIFMQEISHFPASNAAVSWKLRKSLASNKAAGELI